MSKNDYGYFGSGLQGYAHYTQTVKSTTNISNEPSSKVEHSFSSDKVKPGNHKKWCLFWVLAEMILAAAEIILSNILVSSIDIPACYDRIIVLWYCVFGEAGTIACAVAHLIPVIFLLLIKKSE